MALIQQDLIPGSGDQLLTYDTDTNLQWLNLTATAGRSYNEVMGGFGGFTTTHGFHYADGAQISDLRLHANITKGLTEPAHTPSPNDAKNHQGIQTLQDLMNGKTFHASTSVVNTRGIMKPPAPPPDVPTRILGTIRLFLSLLTITGSHTESEGPTASPQMGDPEIGSYLVRVKPVASARKPPTRRAAQRVKTVRKTRKAGRTR
ncbi:MAG: hypothetical protein OJF47_004068 [Nitrospira sp.]|nr:MAG: hypothetical protein OJF47_004068 [Nitrospira sp.]